MSGTWFDYSNVLGGDSNQDRFSFNDDSRLHPNAAPGITDSRKDGKPYNDPAYATLAGVTVNRARLNTALWSFWARCLRTSNGTPIFTESDILEGADLWRWIRTGEKDPHWSQESIDLGAKLYQAMVEEGLTDEQVIARLSTTDATGLQYCIRYTQAGWVEESQESHEERREELLWPGRGSAVGPATNPWVDEHPDEEDEGVHRYTSGFTRPQIFQYYRELVEGKPFYRGE